jgi:hypothetical protein
LQHCDCSGALLARYPTAQLAQQKVPLAVLLQLETDSESMLGGSLVGGDLQGWPTTSSGSLQEAGTATSNQQVHKVERCERCAQWEDAACRKSALWLLQLDNITEHKVMLRDAAGEPCA